jgi:hypothetical protein
MVHRLCHRFQQPIEHDPRWIEIGVDHREVKNVLPFVQRFTLARPEGLEYVKAKRVVKVLVAQPKGPRDKGFPWARGLQRSTQSWRRSYFYDGCGSSGCSSRW